MSAHTPGPWNTSKNMRSIEVRSKEGLKVIAMVTFPKSIGAWNESPFQANARLIAAAPDLLAALKEAQGILAQLTNPDFSQGAGDIYFSARAADAKARAAIARATITAADGGSDG